MPKIRHDGTRVAKNWLGSMVRVQDARTVRGLACFGTVFDLTPGERRPLGSCVRPQPTVREA